jgi:N-formylmaleamate deformylase
MDDWRSNFVEANGVRLHYTRTGGAKPPVVLAHGVTDDGLCWTPVARALAPDYDVVMVDARGHGRSETPPDCYGPATQAADLLGVLGALGLREPAILGHSMGAGTALALAGIAPEVPRAILLEDPGPWWTDWLATEAGRATLAEIGARQDAYRRASREALIADRRTKSPRWQDGDVEPWADAKMRVSTEAFQFFDPATWAGLDWSEALRRITCPVLLITTDPETGGLVSPEAAAALSALVPQTQIARIPGASHSIRRDRFESFIEVVRAFLAA